MITTMKFIEYCLTCDQCNGQEVLHTGDIADGVRVHTIETAVRVARYHKSKGLLLCDKCYRNRNKPASEQMKEGEQE